MGVRSTTPPGRRILLLAAWGLLAGVGCGPMGPVVGEAPAAGPGSSDPMQAAPPLEFVSTAPRGLDLYRPTPDDNAITRERAELGKRLFFDPALSRDGTVACASCHRPELGFSDTLRFSPGVEGRTGSRTTPTLLNRAYGRSFFWDGRKERLEEAVLQPIDNPMEMDQPLDGLVERLEADPETRRGFEEAFPEEGVSAETLGKALATYLRTLLRGEVVGSPSEGRGPEDPAAGASLPAEALSEEARRGRALFLGQARCAVCHAGPNLTQEEFHNTGVAAGSGDPGRYRVTGNEADRGRFKNPTLRGIRHTRPYMHDGSQATLEEVVEFYNRGGGSHPNRSPDIRPLGLTPEEFRLLVAFLETL